MRDVLDAFNALNDYNDPGEGWSTTPLSAILDRLLASSLFLGLKFGEDLLETQNKWYAISHHAL